MNKIKNTILTFLGLGFLVAFSMPAFIENLNDSTKNTLDAIQWTTWAIFALDFIYEFLKSPSKKVYFKTHLIDFIAVLLPFFRPLRLMRMVSFGSFVLQKIAIGKSAAITLKVAITALFLCYLGAVQITILERDVVGSNIKNFSDGLWWAVTTVATVGYGDKYPISNEGRFLAFMLIFTGVALVGVITASIAAWFVQLNESER